MILYLQFHGDKFNDITDDHQSYTQLPIMALAVGIFVSVLGLVGIIGAMLANHVGGRLLLGLVRALAIIPLATVVV